MATSFACPRGSTRALAESTSVDAAARIASTWPGSIARDRKLALIRASIASSRPSADHDRLVCSPRHGSSDRWQLRARLPAAASRSCRAGPMPVYRACRRTGTHRWRSNECHAAIAIRRRAVARDREYTAANGSGRADDGDRPCCSGRCGSASTRCGRRSCSRRWPASPTSRSAGCAASTARALRLRDDHDPRAGRARRRRPCAWSRFDAAETPRSMQLYGVDPDGRRPGGPDGRRRGPGRPRRPQLRLPGAEGDAQGRRVGAAVQAAAVPGDRPRPRSRPPAAGCRSR